MNNVVQRFKKRKIEKHQQTNGIGTGVLKPKNYLEENKPIWKKEYDKGIQKIPEIVVTGKKRYIMSEDPNHQLGFINAVTGGGLNRASISQNGRLLYDGLQTLSGNMSFTDWTKSLIEGNNGFVSDEFAEEHPYISTGINLVSDIAVPYGIYKGINYVGMNPNISTTNLEIYSPGKWFSKYSKQVLPDGKIRYSELGPYMRAEGNNIKLDEQSVRNIFNNAKLRFSNYYKGQEFKQKALNAGFTEDEYTKLLQEIEERINNTQFTGERIGGAWGTNKTIGYRNMRPTTHKIQARYDVNPEELEQTIWHELQHSIGGTSSGELSPRYPMLKKLREFNDKLIPQSENILFNDLINNSDKVENFLVRAGRNPKDAQISTQFNKNRAIWLKNEVLDKSYESRSRLSAALDYMRRLGYNTSEFISNPGKFNEVINDLIKKGKVEGDQLNQLLMIFGNSKGLANYASKMLSIPTAGYFGYNSFVNNYDDNTSNSTRMVGL